MRVLIIPDVHATKNWEKVKEIPKENYDYAVFLGDYFDSGLYDRKLRMWRSNNKWPEQGENVINIINWIREDPEHRKMLIGNHDFSYISAGHDGANVSGHQNEHKHEIRGIILSNYDVFDLAFECDGWVFSHAGFTYTWRSSAIHFLHQLLDQWPEEGGKRWNEREYNLNFLNDFWHKVSHQYGDDNCYQAFDELLDWRGVFSGTGDEPQNSCLWVRPRSLLSDALYPNQVVGHTEYCIGEPLKLRGSSSGSGALDTRIVVVDSQDHDLITIFDTENPGDDFITFAEYNRWEKKVNKAINTILSQQLTDRDAIVNELLKGGVKKEHVKKYYELLGRFDTFKGEPWE